MGFNSFKPGEPQRPLKVQTQIPKSGFEGCAKKKKCAGGLFAGSIYELARPCQDSFDFIENQCCCQAQESQIESVIIEKFQVNLAQSFVCPDGSGEDVEEITSSSSEIEMPWTDYIETVGTYQTAAKPTIKVVPYTATYLDQDGEIEAISIAEISLLQSQTSGDFLIDNNSYYRQGDFNKSFIMLQPSKLQEVLNNPDIDLPEVTISFVNQNLESDKVRIKPVKNFEVVRPVIQVKSVLFIKKDLTLSNSSVVASFDAYDQLDRPLSYEISDTVNYSVNDSNKTIELTANGLSFFQTNQFLPPVLISAKATETGRQPVESQSVQIIFAEWTASNFPVLQLTAENQIFTSPGEPNLEWMRYIVFTFTAYWYKPIFDDFGFFVRYDEFDVDIDLTNSSLYGVEYNSQTKTGYIYLKDSAIEAMRLKSTLGVVGLRPKKGMEYGSSIIHIPTYIIDNLAPRLEIETVASIQRSADFSVDLNSPILNMKLVSFGLVVGEPKIENTKSTLYEIKADGTISSDGVISGEEILKKNLEIVFKQDGVDRLRANNTPAPFDLTPSIGALGGSPVKIDLNSAGCSTLIKWQNSYGSWYAGIEPVSGPMLNGIACSSSQSNDLNLDCSLVNGDGIYVNTFILHDYNSTFRLRNGEIVP